MRFSGNSTTLRPELPAHRCRQRHATQRRRVQRGMCLAVLAFSTAGVSVAPSAVADTSDTLRAALLAARGTSCGALQSHPVLEQAADQMNRDDDKWIDNSTRAVPLEISVAPGAAGDPLPRLKDLGYQSSKAAVIFGAAATEADSIKALLLQGYLKIPDCSYTVYGVSALHNDAKDMIFTTVVLAA